MIAYDEVWKNGAMIRRVEREVSAEQQIADIESELGMARWQRDLVIAALATDHPQRVKAQAVEDRIAPLRPKR